MKHSLRGSLPIVELILDAVAPAIAWRGHSHDFSCLSLCAVLATHDDATISFPRHFSIPIFDFFTFPSWMALSFQRKKFEVCPPQLLISMHCPLRFSDRKVFWHFCLPCLFFCLLFRFEFHNTVFLFGWTWTGTQRWEDGDT